MYIFDRHCECIFYTDWNRHRKSGSGSAVGTTSSSTSMNGQHDGDSGGSSSPAHSVANNHLTSHHSTTSQLTSTTSMFSDSRLINIEEESKLVYGVILSLRNFVRKLSGSQDGFLSYRTSNYKLHYYETPTGLKFVINTDIMVDSLRPVLRQIYTNFYVEYVVKNPLSPIEHPGGEGVNNEYFKVAVDKFVKTLSIYDS
ncbi:8269_t:CDS:2 [Diversispora eburnea]|uniref:Trafficking protein particle complex subunit n=1 Tax=Diversispora eburnea TaxID=1213867 RepID=A0A9N8VC33_9GLOM|nr:8269_t:CDS:2 [Diversispora eburnea]